YEYHCTDQYRPANPGDRAPASAPERYGLGAASLPRQPPLLAAGTRLLLSLALRDVGLAGTRAIRYRTRHGGDQRLRCRNQRLGTPSDPSNSFGAAGSAPALCQCGWRDTGSATTHPRTAHDDRAADLGVCLGTLPDRPVDEPGAGGAFAGCHPGDGPAAASDHPGVSPASDRCRGAPLGPHGLTGGGRA